MDCNFTLNNTVNSVGRAALNRLMTLDCVMKSATRIVTESADGNYYKRGRGMQTNSEKKKAQSGNFALRGYSKSPPQKVVATNQIIPKEAD